MTKAFSAAFVQRITVRLREDDVLYRDFQPQPTAAFVADVASRLVRDTGNAAAEGIVIIANAKEVLGRPAAVRGFQFALMDCVRGHFADTRPDALRTRGLRTLVPYMRRGKVPTLRHCGTHDDIAIDGLDSYRMLHTDEDSLLFVSLCHYDRRDIAGGAPRFLDLHALAGSRSRADLRRVIRPQPSKTFFDGEAPFGNHWVARLQPEFAARAEQDAKKIACLDYSQMPIVIFSNRIEDGIMHGVTPIRKTGPAPRRRLYYVTIGYRA